MNIRNVSIFLLFLGLTILATGCPSSGSSAGYFPAPPDNTSKPDGGIIDGYVTDGLDSYTDSTSKDSEDSVEPVDVLLDQDIGPTGCENDDDCPDGFCNPVTASCVECLETENCPDGTVCQDWTCVEVELCGPDMPCPDGLVCDPDLALCVECLQDSDCTAAEGGFCNDGECQYPCGSGCPAGTVCDYEKDLCVECLGDPDCAEEEWCFVEIRSCLPDVCTPGALGCVGNWTARCADNGSAWFKDAECPAGTTCKQGMCETDPTLCDPGELKCLDDLTLGVCSGNGNGWEEKPCPDGTFCQNAECVFVCVPDCEGKECGSDGCNGTCGDCGYGSCVNFQCQGPICFEGERKCIGNGVSYCMGPDEGWSDPEQCPPGTVCENGECMDQPWECEPGDAVCDGNTPLVCGNDGQWVYGPACPAGTFCQGGQCYEEPPICDVGEAKCVGNSVSYCEDGFVWSSPKPCPANTQCSNGQCQPLSPDTCPEIMDCLEGFTCTQQDPFACAPECFEVANPEAFEIAMELFYCVFESCGKWKPGSGCYNNAINQGWCEELYYMCFGGCQPQCDGQQCGSDGCGGVCGVCPVGFVCSPNGQCVDSCQPQCQGKDCGSDGCGGTCGSCPSGTSCNASGICIQTCTPSCAGKECGSDGCGGSCGLCGDGEACKYSQCVPSLSCKELLECMWSCYNDICSNQCYQDSSPAAQSQFMDVVTCLQGECGEMADQACQQQAVNGPCYDVWTACQNCTPDCEGKQCGADGCGGTCGNCPAGYACDNYGYCLCQPQCDGKECGNDGCGGSCGTCPSGSACSWQGKCVCMPDCTDKECGGDGCGGSCGVCPSGYTCTPNGLCEYQQPQCGNGWCQTQMGENCESCPQDCGPCYPECGDGVCDPDMESCATCPEDCGSCSGGPCCEPHDEVGCDSQEVTACVCQMDPYCCQVMWDEICVNQAVESCGADCGCVPNCYSADGQWKECGSDGCGGSCGTCSAGAYCDSYGQCVYEPMGDCGAVVECMEGYYCYTDDPFACAEECFKVSDDYAMMMAMEYYSCVLSICGDWEPGTDCHTYTKIEACKDIYDECTGTCTPNCYNKECGNDGCGGYCGSCQGGQACVNYQCVGDCEPSCITEWGTQKECGSDGCGGICGECPAGYECQPDVAICVPGCTPECDGRECGSDGCGGICGQCAFGEQCVNGQCFAACEPNCNTDFGFPKQCGSDGCGGSCGTCPEGTVCDETFGFCQQSCVPNCQGKECGNDGCGGSCGTCDFGLTCVNNQCASSYACTDMLDCAMVECNFDIMCSMNCYQTGSDASKTAFQNLALCVVQACGYFDISAQCAMTSIEGSCQQEYEVCLDN